MFHIALAPGPSCNEPRVNAYVKRFTNLASAADVLSAYLPVAANLPLATLYHAPAAKSSASESQNEAFTYSETSLPVRL